MATNFTQAGIQKFKKLGTLSTLAFVSAVNIGCASSGMGSGQFSQPDADAVERLFSSQDFSFSPELIAANKAAMASGKPSGISDGPTVPMEVVTGAELTSQSSQDNITTFVYSPQKKALGPSAEVQAAGQEAFPFDPKRMLEPPKIHYTPWRVFANKETLVNSGQNLRYQLDQLIDKDINFIVLVSERDFPSSRRAKQNAERFIYRLNHIAGHRANSASPYVPKLDGAFIANAQKIADNASADKPFMLVLPNSQGQKIAYVGIPHASGKSSGLKRDNLVLDTVEAAQNAAPIISRTAKMTQKPTL